MTDRQIRLVIGELKGLSERAITKLALDITANLIETTPVDTGWARANWVPQIGSPYKSDGGVGLTDDERRAGVSGARNAQAAGKASLLTYDLKRGPVFISNNVPYVEILNTGSSKQAPAAFIEAAIQQAVNENRNIR